MLSENACVSRYHQTAEVQHLNWALGRLSGSEFKAVGPTKPYHLCFEESVAID